MKKWISAALVLLAITGCTAWTRPDTSEEQFRRDLAECEYEATKATAYLPTGHAYSSIRLDIKSECMKMKGYRRTFR